MDITCQACSTRLSIPDDKLPKNVPVVTGKCPKCQSPIEIRLDGGQAAAPSPAAAPAPAPAAEPPAPAASLPAAAAPPAQAPANGASHEHAEAPPPPPPPPAPAPAEAPPPPPPLEEFVAGQKLALVCLGADEAPAAKEALEAAEYKVSVPANPEEAVQRLRRTKYELLLLDDAYGGSPEKNPVLAALQPMAMSMRRHMCVGLVGKDFWTMDNMTAFAKSVNFVIAQKDLSKLQEIVKQAVADNEQFYHVFREALREVGKA